MGKMAQPHKRVPPLRGLYAVTPDGRDGVTLVREVEAVLAGGCRWLQYRDKSADAADRLSRAKALQALCCEHGAALIINDDVELAATVGAAGVHLGRDDDCIADARRALGNDAIIGASCYDDLETARQAAAAGADYVAFGTVFPSPTKPLAVRAPLELLGRCRAELQVPVCAIGGITLGNAPTAIAAGADLLAVITDLFAAPDLTTRAAAYQRLFEESRP